VGKEIKKISDNLAALEHYYEKQDMATRECLFALKTIVLSIDSDIVHLQKYQIPFFTYNGFNLGFLWVYRKKILVGFIEDKKTLPTLLTGRKKDNVFTMEINPLKDIPIYEIQHSLKELIKKYRQQSNKK